MGYGYAGVAVPPLMQSNGLLGASADPATISATSILTSGQIQGVAIWVPDTGPYAGGNATVNVWFGVSTAGATLTANQNFIGLYSSTGQQLTVTPDLSTVWNTTGNKTVAWTTPVVLTAQTWYIALILSVGTTPPTLRATSAVAAVVNIGPSGPVGMPDRSATGATGQTALPASINPSTYFGAASTCYAVFLS